MKHQITISPSLGKKKTQELMDYLAENLPKHKFEITVNEPDKFVYSANDVINGTGISRARLSQLIRGRVNYRNGKVESTQAALLINGVDYVSQLGDDNRGHIMYSRSAIDKLCELYDIDKSSFD